MKLLEQIFASKAQAKLLDHFFKNPNSRFYQRELALITSESLGSIQYELKRLQNLELINSEKQKRKVFYFINKNFYLYSELRDIILKTTQKNL